MIPISACVVRSHTLLVQMPYVETPKLIRKNTCVKFFPSDRMRSSLHIYILLFKLVHRIFVIRLRLLELLHSLHCFTRFTCFIVKSVY